MRWLWLILCLPVAGPVVAAAPDGSSSQESLQRWITEMVRDNIPLQYDDTRKWGGTKQVFDGLKVYHDGLRIKTHRRMKEVNHGTWKRYSIRLVNPDEQFQVRLENVARTEDGRLTMDVVAAARLFLFGRLSQWQTGVQLISLSADAEASVVLRVRCELGLQWRWEHFPPDVELDPVVNDADLKIVDFRLRRISNARGPLIKELGEELHDVLSEKVDEKRGKLVQNLNRQIDKNRDHLRLSVHDRLLTLWQELQGPQRETSAGASPPAA